MPDDRAPLHIDADWRERATLRDGRVVTLRLGKRSDRELLRRGFARLSPESRYRRFFTAKVNLSNAELDYLTDIDQHDHVAIGAFETGPDGVEEGLGVARFVRDAKRPDAAEAAIAVVDDAQGLGLGSLLFQRLVAAARERGITCFCSFVLGTNRPMQEMLRELAGPSRTKVEDGVVYIESLLPELGPEHPVSEPPRESTGYHLLRKAAEGLLQIARLGTRGGSRE